MTSNPKGLLSRAVDRVVGIASRPCAEDRALIDRIRTAKLTYLSKEKLGSIANTVRRIESEAVQGSFIEAGCALGGSSILIAKAKGDARAFRVHDVFGMIPPPGQEDGLDVQQRYEVIVNRQALGIGGDRYYGYEDDLLRKVKANLAGFGVDTENGSVELVPGLLQQTLHVDDAVAFAHIDVDWYDPVMTCLQRIVPRLSVGGAIILDDYHDWSGCRKATDEYFAQRPKWLAWDDRSGSLKITRVS